MKKERSVYVARQTIYIWDRRLVDIHSWKLFVRITCTTGTGAHAHSIHKHSKHWAKWEYGWIWWRAKRLMLPSTFFFFLCTDFSFYCSCDFFKKKRQKTNYGKYACIVNTTLNWPWMEYRFIQENFFRTTVNCFLLCLCVEPYYVLDIYWHRVQWNAKIIIIIVKI